jgi:hypothetical protein
MHEPFLVPFALASLSPTPAARQRDAAVIRHIPAIRPLVVRLVPLCTISPLRANSTRRGLTVLGFIASSVAISSSVLGRHARNSYTRRCIAFSVAVLSESAAAAEVGEPLTLGARAAKSGSGVLSMS